MRPTAYFPPIIPSSSLAKNQTDGHHIGASVQASFSPLPPSGRGGDPRRRRRPRPPLSPRPRRQRFRLRVPPAGGGGGQVRGGGGRGRRRRRLRADLGPVRPLRGRPEDGGGQAEAGEEDGQGEASTSLEK